MKRFLVLGLVGCLFVGSNLQAGNHSTSVSSKNTQVMSEIDSVISKVKSFTKSKDKSLEVSLNQYKDFNLVSTSTSMKGQEFETLVAYLNSVKQSIAALNSCSQDKDGFRSYLKDVLWSCSYDLNADLNDSISIDFGFYKACAVSLKTIFDRREEVTKVKPTSTEKDLLKKLDTVIQQFTVASAEKSEKTAITEKSDKRVEKNNALRKLMFEFASDKSLENVKASDLCILETIVSKTGSEKIVDQDSKNKFEKENKKSEEPQELDAGKLQGIPAGGLTDKVNKDEKPPVIKDPVLPAPTGISPVPVAPENNAVLPFDFGNLLSSLLNNGNQNQVQIPNIRTTGNREVRQGNNNQVPAPTDAAIPTPTPETSPEPTPSATPSAAPLNISLPSAGTNSASSGVSGLENLGKNLGIPVTPVATPNASANANIIRAAELAGQKKRDEMEAELRMLGAAGPMQQQMPTSGNGLNRGNSLLNRYNLNGKNNNTSNRTQQLPLSTDEVRGDLGRTNAGGN